jgi:hypothetical protein
MKTVKWLGAIFKSELATKARKILLVQAVPAKERSLAKGYGPRQPQKAFQIVVASFLLADLDYINIAILEFIP